MSGIYVCGIGAVSPAGWGIAALRNGLESGATAPIEYLTRPGWKRSMAVRQVPPPAARPAFLAHPRLRRAGAISQYTVGAAIEACGGDVARAAGGFGQLGIVVCMLAGSVAYTRRFYEELLREPATASPLLFPETVFNAASSHLAAFLETSAVNYTLVGDEGVFLEGLALAANWLMDDKVDACLVVGAEEVDWIVAYAVNLFRRGAIHSGGAGALLLKREHDLGAIARLEFVTDSFSFTQNQTRSEAAAKMRAQLPPSVSGELLCLSAENPGAASAPEEGAWRGWNGARLAVKTILGEGLVAAAAWQCVAACDAVGRNRFPAANVSVVGDNQQAIGARFVRAISGLREGGMGRRLAGEN